MASSPPSAPRTSLAEPCQRPGSSASTPPSANLRWCRKGVPLPHCPRGTGYCFGPMLVVLVVVAIGSYRV
jgi:hypothetical protein